MYPPAADLAPVTPSDSATISDCIGLYVVTAGDLSLVMANGQTRTYAEAVLPTAPFEFNFPVLKVRSTGTTASDIYAIKSK